MRLVERNGLVVRRPYIAILRESAPRAGFFEPDEFTAVQAQLPPPVRALSWSSCT